MPAVAGGVVQTSYRVRWGQETRVNLSVWVFLVPLLLPTRHPIASRMPQTRRTDHFLDAASRQMNSLAIRPCRKYSWGESLGYQFIAVSYRQPRALLMESSTP